MVFHPEFFTHKIFLHTNVSTQFFLQRETFTHTHKLLHGKIARAHTQIYTYIHSPDRRFQASTCKRCANDLYNHGKFSLTLAIQTSPAGKDHASSDQGWPQWIAFCNVWVTCQKQDMSHLRCKTRTEAQVHSKNGAHKSKVKVHATSWDLDWHKMMWHLTPWDLCWHRNMWHLTPWDLCWHRKMWHLTSWDLCWHRKLWHLTSWDLCWHRKM